MDILPSLSLKDIMRMDLPFINEMVDAKITMENNKSRAQKALADAERFKKH